MVSINGVVTTAAAARAAGLLAPEQQNEFKVDPSTGRAVQQQAPGQVTRSGADDNIIAPNDAANDQAPIDPAAVAVEAAQSDALNSVARTIGNERANELLDQVALTGELESVTNYGVSPSQVEAIKAGYVAKANAVLGGVGVNADALSAGLDDYDLAAARKATIDGDVATLRRLGEQAVGKLSRLDVTDPQGFEAMMDARDIAWEKTERGYLVSIEGIGMTSWANAVRMGALKFLQERE
jgi:hypothetical protein